MSYHTNPRDIQGENSIIVKLELTWRVSSLRLRNQKKLNFTMKLAEFTNFQMRNSSQLNFNIFIQKQKSNKERIFFDQDIITVEIVQFLTKLFDIIEVICKILMLSYRYINIDQILRYKILMAQKILNAERVSTVKGLNFQGKISIKGENLRLDITQFKRGKFYFIGLDNSTMQKEVSNDWIFSKTIDIFQELIGNKLLEINDEGYLIVPMQVSSKNKLINLKISIPLKNVQFKNQEQENHKLYDEIAQIYKEKISQQNILAFINYSKATIPFNFIGDTTNPHYKSFQVSKNGNKIKMLGESIWKNFNHGWPLPNLAKYSFRFKSLNYLRYLYVGICSKKIRGEDNIYNNPHYIGLNLYDRNIYSNSTKKLAVDKITIEDNESIFKMEINLIEKILTWYMDDKKLCQEQINKNLLNQEIYPVVSLYFNGNAIEFID